MPGPLPDEALWDKSRVYPRASRQCQTRRMRPGDARCGFLPTLEHGIRLQGRDRRNSKPFCAPTFLLPLYLPLFSACSSLCGLPEAPSPLPIPPSPPCPGTAQSAPHRQHGGQVPEERDLLAEGEPKGPWPRTSANSVGFLSPPGEMPDRARMETPALGTK